jgi:hypothetical protein
MRSTVVPAAVLAARVSSSVARWFDRILYSRIRTFKYAPVLVLVLEYRPSCILAFAFENIKMKEKNSPPRVNRLRAAGGRGR